MTYYQSLNLSFENFTTANTISSMQYTTHVVRENHMEEVNAAHINQIKSSQMAVLAKWLLVIDLPYLHQSRTLLNIGCT